MLECALKKRKGLSGNASSRFIGSKNVKGAAELLHVQMPADDIGARKCGGGWEEARHHTREVSKREKA